MWILTVRPFRHSSNPNPLGTRLHKHTKALSSPTRPLVLGTLLFKLVACTMGGGVENQLFNIKFT